MKKGLLAALLCAMIFLLLPAAAYAVGGDLGGAGYDGSKDKPYQISDAADLQAFADIVNKGNYGACAVLTNNITLENSGENWTPIGSSNATAYTGTFDGQNHTISGLSVKVVSDSGDAYAGLFGYNNGTIENVKIEDSNITATAKGYSAYVGGICGYNYGGEITNCSSQGTVTAEGSSAYGGGICGYNNGPITNCSSAGTVTAEGSMYAYGGGICGRNLYGTITNCSSAGDVKAISTKEDAYGGGICGRNLYGTITNCSSKGDVTAKGSSACGGGICGDNPQNGTITNCSSTGDVTAEGENKAYGGGICGFIGGGTITNCSSKGDVTAEGSKFAYGGGICGDNYGTIINCSSAGDVKAISTQEDAYGGGICGLNHGRTITNCSSTGDVTVEGDDTDGGGICGYNWAIITNCYFLSGTAASGIGDDRGTATNVGEKTSEQFASGEVAWLLDQGNTSHQWAQQIGAEDFPRSMMETGDEKYAVVRVLVHFPENAGNVSCYTNVGTVLPAYPSQMNGKKYAFYADEDFKISIDTANYKYQEDTEIYAKAKKSSSSSAPTEYNLRFDTNGGDSMSTTVEQANTAIDLDKYVPTRDGYEFVGWYADEALTKPIDEITLTQSATIYAKWEKIAEEEEEIKEEAQEETTEPEGTAVSFADIRESDWFYKAVSYAVENSLMSGMGDGTFSPNTPLQREMFATVLWNLEGNPAPKDVAPFLDVTSDKYYADAIAWASENGIVAGFGDTFGVGVPITREQFAVMLHNYAQYKGYDVSVGEDTNILSYPDALEISEYAFPAMQWACGADIMGGNDDGTLNPQGRTTRAEAATMLMNFCENVAK